MAFAPGFNSRWYHAEHRASAWSRGFNTTKNVNMLDVSTLENQAKVFIPGQVEGSASAEMFFDTLYASSSQAAQFFAALTTQAPETFCPNGAAISNACQLINANGATLTAGSTVTDAVMLNVEVQPDGPIDFGVVIAAEAAITVDTNGTSVNNGAATANGGVAHLHVTAFSGLTSNSVVIEHSTNDSVWSTLATSTLVTAVGSERIVIAPGTTVNQYLRIRDDVTGTGTCTRFVAFARR